MPLSTIERWQDRSGCRLIELWGMTEIAGLGATHSLHTPPMPGTIGISLPGVELRVADVDNAARTVPANQSDVLMSRGPLVMLGYHENEAAAAQTIEPDGWLHTGDVAVMDSVGYVRIVDRIKDMIITGGYSIFPAEI